MLYLQGWIALVESIMRSLLSKKLQKPIMGYTKLSPYKGIGNLLVKAYDIRHYKRNYISKPLVFW